MAAFCFAFEAGAASAGENQRYHKKTRYVHSEKTKTD